MLIKFKDNSEIDVTSQCSSYFNYHDLPDSYDNGNLYTTRRNQELFYEDKEA